MKKILLLIILFAGISLQSEACVDPHPDSLVFNFSIDTVNCDAIIEISNLQIMGGTSNQFCSCGVNNQIAGLGDIVYLVFVDSATHEPVVGFDQFGLNDFASDSWDLSASDFDWNGFVSDVNEAGLLADQPVNLWIHIDLFATVEINEYVFNPCDEPYILFEIFGGSGPGLGTDEWDDENNELEADDHQSITYFNWNQIYFNIVDEDYIDYFDDIVTNYYASLSISNPEKNEELNIYPNPFNGIINLNRIPDNTKEIVIYNALGSIVYQTNSITKQIDVNQLPKGIYQLKLNSTEEIFYRTIVKH